MDSLQAIQAGLDDRYEELATTQRRLDEVNVGFLRLKESSRDSFRETNHLRWCLVETINEYHKLGDHESILESRIDALTSVIQKLSDGTHIQRRREILASLSLRLETSPYSHPDFINDKIHGNHICESTEKINMMREEVLSVAMHNNALINKSKRSLSLRFDEAELVDKIRLRERAERIFMNLKNELQLIRSQNLKRNKDYDHQEDDNESDFL
jgi:hypothetical protein